MLDGYLERYWYWEWKFKLHNVLHWMIQIDIDIEYFVVYNK